MKIINLAEVERVKTRRTARRLEARVAEIAEVLVELGGGAHRDTVIARLARRRDQFPPSADIIREYVEAFEAHIAEVAGRGMRPIFHLPFGPGSHRWALTPEAHVHLHLGRAQA